jgi:hypothetical protein
MNLILGIHSNTIYLLPVINLGGCYCHHTLTIGWIVFEAVIKVDK